MFYYSVSHNIYNKKCGIVIYKVVHIVKKRVFGIVRWHNVNYFDSPVVEIRGFNQLYKTKELF